VSGRKLLIIDDDPNILEGLRDILEDAGFSVDSASTAAEARARLSGELPALVFIDFNLPDATGVSLAAEIRRQAPGAKIFLMTGMSAEEMAGAAKGVVDDVLTKPVDPARLIALIQKTLGPAA
jgi:DNA-binding response OmpR family regulator